MLIDSFTVPIEVISEANKFEHWIQGHKRHKKQKNLVRFYLGKLALYRDIPLTIKLIRISPRKLDQQDNLPMAFKYIVDEIASILSPGKAQGRSDDNPLFKWEYDQEKGNVREKKIRVELHERNTSPYEENTMLSFSRSIP